MSIQPAIALLKRDLLLASRKIGETLIGIVFFVLAATLFPIGVGASPDLLSRIGPGIIWVLALLSVLVSLERLFAADFEDGTLEQLVLAPTPLEWLVLAKCIAHWLVSGALLALISPLLALLMNLPATAIWTMPLALLIGTPCLTLIGAIGASLLVGSRRSGALLAIIILPLYIPVLIFGVSAVDGYVLGLGGASQLLVLGAMTVAAAAMAPFAIAASIRLALQ